MAQSVAMSLLHQHKQEWMDPIPMTSLAKFELPYPKQRPDHIQNAAQTMQRASYDLAANLGEALISMGELVVSLSILNVIERYGRHTIVDGGSANQNQEAWIGKSFFLPKVHHYVKRKEPVQLTMPAFPYKSLNRDSKVLGHLPDLGEELALMRLHSMAVEIEAVYTPGAIVNVATDGILFNDLVGITDEECWEYHRGLESIVEEQNLTSLNVLVPQHILGMLTPQTMNQSTYLASIEQCREELDSTFGITDNEIRDRIAKDADTRLTYCGMLKFLRLELETDPRFDGVSANTRLKIIKAKAKQCMQRSEAFTLAIRTKLPNHVRLSMHPSSGVNKLSIPLIPDKNGNFQRSPWHSCVLVQSDQSYRCVHSYEVDASHTLVYRKGRPWFYTE